MSPEYNNAKDGVKQATSFGMSLIREYTDAKLRLGNAKTKVEAAEAESAMKFAIQSMGNLRSKYVADKNAETQRYVADKNAEGRGKTETKSDLDDFMEHRTASVSYTHLTLPTICSV